MRFGRRLLVVVIGVGVVLAGVLPVGSTVPAAPPDRDAGLLWVGDAETGDLSQYQDAPWNDVGGQPPRIVTDPVRDGRYAIALTVTGSTTPEDGICCGTRNELLPRFRDLREGDDLWFGFSTLLAADFPTDGSWQVITQFKQHFDGSPPLSLNVEGAQYEVEGGYGHPDGPMEFSRQLGTAVTGVWVDWALHVRFSADPTIGFVEVWRDGALALPRFAPESGTMYPGTGDRAGGYVKTGPYRDPTTSGLSTMYLDDWRIGTTRDAVGREPSDQALAR